MLFESHAPVQEPPAQEYGGVDGRGGWVGLVNRRRWLGWNVVRKKLAARGRIVYNTHVQTFFRLSTVAPVFWVRPFSLVYGMLLKLENGIGR